MSGIAGVLHLDGGPVDPADISALAAGISPLGLERTQHWSGAGVALVHALLAATPQAIGEEQPVLDATGSLAAVFDGRLDNRTELLERLPNINRRGRRTLTDAEILMGAYEAWGSDLVPRLLGDFAFALWDGGRRRLLCARDPVGVRPFLYRIAGRRLVWASALRPLAFLSGAPTQPNPGMVAEYLASALTSRHETVFEGVYRLPPGHTLIAERGAVRLTRYWDIDPAREVRHGSHQAYAEHLREVLTTAVRARMRTLGPVAVELSGGLDSSIVVGIAQRQTRSPASESGDVTTLSLVYPGQACDESTWIDSVAGYWGIDPIKLVPPPSGGFDLPGECRRTGEVPAFPVMPYWGALYERANELGCRSVLNGIGADEWFTGTAWETADLLRRGRIQAAVARSRLAAGQAEVSAPTAMWRFGIRPVLTGLLPAAIPTRIRAQRAVRRTTWVPPAFARSVALRERLELTPRRDLRTISQAQIWYSLNNGHLSAACEALASMASRHRIEPRMPFLDVRLVELALAVPEAERFANGRPKGLLRTAARGLVPDRLLARIDKPSPGHLIAEELLAPSILPLLRFERAAAEGWVDRERLQAIHGQLVAEHRAGRPVSEDRLWPLWRAIGVEMWLGSTFAPDTGPAAL